MKNENEIINAVCEWLEWKKIFHFRINNIPVFDATRKTFRRMPKHSVKGVADICCLKNGTSYWLECKTEKGKQSAGQEDFEENVLKTANQYFIIRDVDKLSIIFT